MWKDKRLWAVVLLAAGAAAVLALPGLPEGGPSYAAAMAGCVAVVAVTAFLLARAAVASFHSYASAFRSAAEVRQSQQEDMRRELADTLKQQEHQMEEMGRIFAEQMDTLSRKTGEAQSLLQSAVEEHLLRSEETLREELKRLYETSDAMTQHYTQTLEDVRAVSVESVQALSQDLQEFGLKMEQQLIDVSHQNTRELSAVYTDAVSASVQALTQGNEAMLNRQTESYRKNLTSTADRYDTIIAAHVKKLEQQAEARIKHFEEANHRAMEGYLGGLEQKLRAYGMENAGLFSRSMVDYRDKFVEANAQALAQVQDGTMQAVTNANEKVAELSDALRQTSASLQNLKDLIKYFVSEQQAQGKAERERQQEFREELDDNFSDFRKETVKAISTRLEQYNDSLVELGQYVNEVMESVQSNTESYRQTLAQIQKSQADMNSLTKQDIELMQKLLR